MLAPSQAGFFGGWAIIITVLGLLGRSASLWRNARLKPKSTTQTAIGIKHPRIVQKAQGSMGGSFNTREFFHGKSASFVSRMKIVFLLFAFAVPLLMLAVDLSHASVLLLCVAFVSQYIGLLAERWYFFAEARHPQNIYYQGVS
jgi:sulfite dehydrogenase (quinone) subunit SoeC